MSLLLRYHCCHHNVVIAHYRLKQCRHESPIGHILVVWQYFNGLLGRGRSPPPDINASDLHRCIDEKVAGVGAATSGADPPSFTSCPARSSFIAFRPVTTDDVSELVRTLPDKSCLSDPLPTWLSKNVDVLAPFLCRLFNRSLERGVVPPSFKSGYVTPLLKKTDHDADDMS